MDYDLETITETYFSMELEEADQDKSGCYLGRDGAWLCPSMVVDMLREAYKAGQKNPIEY